MPMTSWNNGASADRDARIGKERQVSKDKRRSLRAANLHLRPEALAQPMQAHRHWWTP
jgi:hypothetical protein